VSKESDASLPARAGLTTPGTLFAKKNGLLVCCGETTVLCVHTVQVEGRKPVKARDFANGSRLKSGERFGDT
jgi:methionyl-tRNA formyltransferase